MSLMDFVKLLLYNLFTKTKQYHIFSVFNFPQFLIMYFVMILVT